MMNFFSIRRHEDTACCIRKISGSGVILIWELTSSCNLNCLHCFVNKMQKELPLEACLKIIKLLKNTEVKKIIITGGEPTLRKDLPEIIDNIQKLNVIIDLNTNATLLTEIPGMGTVIRKVTEFTVSLDGPNSYIHDMQRNSKGAFERTIAGINFIRKFGKKIDICTVVTKLNYQLVSEIVNLCEKLEVSSITFSRYLPTTNYKTKKYLTLTQTETKEFMYQIRVVRRKTNIPIRTVGFVKGNRGMCLAGKKIFYLDAEGYLHPCGLLQSKKYHIFSLEGEKSLALCPTQWEKELFLFRKELHKNLL